jgi:hypothetical protein
MVNMNTVNDKFRQRHCQSSNPKPKMRSVTSHSKGDFDVLRADGRAVVSVSFGSRRRRLGERGELGGSLGVHEERDAEVLEEVRARDPVQGAGVVPAEGELESSKIHKNVQENLKKKKTVFIGTVSCTLALALPRVL